MLSLTVVFTPSAFCVYFSLIKKYEVCLNYFWFKTSDIRNKHRINNRSYSVKCWNDRGKKWPYTFFTWVEILALYLLISYLKCWCYRIQKVLQLLNADRHGIPEEHISDNMDRSFPVMIFKLLLDSSVSSILSRLKILLRNGLAERTVQTAVKIFVTDHLRV